MQKNARWAFFQQTWNSEAGEYQAMKMAMKANMKIRTAPPMGKMMCIIGTMDSTTSVVSVFCEWSDMALPWVQYRASF
jgi:hypothetical protein